MDRLKAFSFARQRRAEGLNRQKAAVQVGKKKNNKVP